MPGPGVGAAVIKYGAPILLSVLGSIFGSHKSKGQKPPTWEEIQAHGLTPEMIRDITPEDLNRMAEAFGTSPQAIRQGGINTQMLQKFGVTKELVDSATHGLSAEELARQFGPDALGRDTARLYEQMSHNPAFTQQLAQAAATGAQAGQAVNTRLGASGGGASGIGAVAGALGGQVSAGLRSNAASSLWAPAFETAQRNLDARINPYTQGQMGALDARVRGALNTQDWYGRGALQTQDLTTRAGLSRADDWSRLQGQRRDLLARGAADNQRYWAGFRGNEMGRPSFMNQLGGSMLGAAGSGFANWFKTPPAGGGT